MAPHMETYDQIPVDVIGDAPPPVESFEAADLVRVLQRAVARSGYDKPTPVQRHALSIVGKGMDLIASAQTGSGKVRT